MGPDKVLMITYVQSKLVVSLEGQQGEDVAFVFEFGDLAWFHVPPAKDLPGSPAVALSKLTCWLPRAELHVAAGRFMYRLS